MRSLPLTAAILGIVVISFVLLFWSEPFAPLVRNEYKSKVVGCYRGEGVNVLEIGRDSIRLLPGGERVSYDIILDKSQLGIHPNKAVLVGQGEGGRLVASLSRDASEIIPYHETRGEIEIQRNDRPSYHAVLTKINCKSGESAR